MHCVEHQLIEFVTDSLNSGFFFRRKFMKCSVYRYDYLVLT